MSQSRTDELVDRLLSRKLWLCLITIILAAYGHTSGYLAYDDFVKTVLGAVGIFSLAEGAADAAGAWHSTPDTTVKTTVNTTNTDGPPEVKRETEAKPSARPKRVRKPKATAEKVVLRG